MYPTILVVDDEVSILQSLGGLLSDEGFEVLTAGNGYEALKTIESGAPDLVLLDIWMPGFDGVETLKEIKKITPLLPVIMITGHGTIETAVNTIKFGAYDFIEKPISFDKVVVAISNALNFRKLQEENRYLRTRAIARHAIDGMSPAIEMLKLQVIQAGPSESAILISGEHGTGKELVSRNIHQLSPRAESPLITVNCAEIPDHLMESELFGHEKGAFTEATAKMRGKFELAEGGTLFFDEIGELSLSSQAKLLRVLEDGTFRRVGGSREFKTDVRVIAATRHHLESRIAAGHFREDLFYRLNVVPITVPPLRERKADIPILASIFLNQFAKRSGLPAKTLTEEAEACLADYSWPGNVRELKNLMERLAVMTDAPTLSVRDLPHNLFSGNDASTDDLTACFQIRPLGDAVAAFEARYARYQLAAHSGDLNLTAKATGVSEDTLRSLLPE
ncbi:MAG: Fis family transcriptional regulator [Deltaproteobacteria bacterium]|nr:MAG: Fis family transcriptional regulator [Deltaproteobacteria bacterium]